jgi:putative ABC transport system permease protein
VRASNIWHLYRVRLRARLFQEAFAVLGIAAGVALLFSSQVASSSLLSSVAQLSHGIVGHASLQVLARDPHGMDEGTLRAIRRTPGVLVAAPLLEASANAVGPSGSESVELVGADTTLQRLGGAFAHDDALEPFAGIGAIVMPAPLARRTGVRKFGQELTLQLNGRSARAPLYEQLGARQIGSLISSPIVVAPLSFAQQMSGLQGRVSRVLVQPEHGREAQVRAALVRLVAGRLNVEPTSYDEQLFTKAATASNQSTELFAVISALVGFLFAFNAMLLTVPQRRRLIADLRRDGYMPKAVIVILLVDAIVLGLAACVLGLVLGDQLSVHLFHSLPGYLASAFAVGSQRVVSLSSVAVAAGGGMLAALVAVLSPLRDILSRDPTAATATRVGAGTGGAIRTVAPSAGAVLCVGAATWIQLSAPQAAIFGMLLLAVALLLVLPIALAAIAAAIKRIARAFTSATPHLAAMELGSTGARGVAIAATGAIAAFGSVSIVGAHGDLLRGLEGAARDTNASADIQISPAGSYNLLRTAPFAASGVASLRALPGVRAVRLYRGGLLDLGTRKVWVIAPSQASVPLLPRSQLLGSDPGLAEARVRAGGWVVLSKALAEERHLHVGGSFTLPSPIPTGFRVAALSTNIGWAPGAMIMNSSDYAQAWGSPDASSYDVLLSPGAPISRVIGELRGALRGTGLAVSSAAAHAERQRVLSRQGLARLTQIATLILVGAILAMAAAMGTLVWQRRPWLAKLKLEGFSRGDLWRAVLLESGLLLACGCAAGALFGLYGQQQLDRALANVINFPVVSSVGTLTALWIFSLLSVAAVAALSLSCYAAAQVSPATALQE